jgi:hypothetical protein
MSVGLGEAGRTAASRCAISAPDGFALSMPATSAAPEILFAGIAL